MLSDQIHNQTDKILDLERTLDSKKEPLKKSRSPTKRGKSKSPSKKSPRKTPRKRKALDLAKALKVFDTDDKPKDKPSTSTGE